MNRNPAKVYVPTSLRSLLGLTIAFAQKLECVLAEKKRRASETFRYANYWKPIRIEQCRRLKTWKGMQY